jgi:hypothetical protein
MTPAVVQGFALAWLAVVTVVITAAIPVGLAALGAFKTWRAALGPKVEALQAAATEHGVKLDGILNGKIAAGAAAVVAVHEAGLAVAIPVDASPATVAAAKAAHIAALQAELAALTPTPA